MGRKRWALLLAALLLGLLGGCTAAPSPAAEEAAAFLQRYSFPGESVAAPASLLPLIEGEHPRLPLDDLDLTTARTDYLLLPRNARTLLLTADERFRARYRFVAAFGEGETAQPYRLYSRLDDPFDAGAWEPCDYTFITPPGGRLHLRQCHLDRRHWEDDGTLRLILRWTVDAAIGDSLAMTLQLVGPDGLTVVAQEQHWADQLRSDSWFAGMTMETRETLLLPPSLQAGPYALRLRFSPPLQVVEGEPPLTPIDILRLRHLPDVRLAPPPVPDHPLDATFASAIALVGYDAPARVDAGGTLPLVLYWHVLAPLPADEKVFVHLLTADGQLVAQVDAVPLHWSYPTGQWKRGEFIRDAYHLDLSGVPRGDYRLAVGFYDPRSGERLPVEGTGAEAEADRIVLTEVAVR